MLPLIGYTESLLPLLPLFCSLSIWNSMVAFAPSLAAQILQYIHRFLQVSCAFIERARPAAAPPTSQIKFEASVPAHKP